MYNIFYLFSVFLYNKTNAITLWLTLIYFFNLLKILGFSFPQCLAYLHTFGNFKYSFFYKFPVQPIEDHCPSQLHKICRSKQSSCHYYSPHSRLCYPFTRTDYHCGLLANYLCPFPFKICDVRKIPRIHWRHYFSQKFQLCLSNFKCNCHLFYVSIKISSLLTC